MGRILLAAMASMFCACASRPATSPAFEHLPALRGDYFPLTSSHTRRQYHVYVRLPEGYDASKSRTYPVIYLLDGDSLFPLLAPTHLLLNIDEGLPEAILVGIAYGSFEPSINKRNIDFAVAGAPKFLSFMKDELIPQIERRYKTDPSRRTLVGQSLGGHFVLWSAVEDPNLFWAAIASNASFPEPRDNLLRAPSVRSAGQAHIALISGTRDTPQRMQYATDWVHHWTAHPEPPWQVRHFIIDGGTHSASIGRAYREAMVWLFKEGTR